MPTRNPNKLRLARIVLWLYALLVVVFGLAAIPAPTPLAATVDVLLPTATARIDFAGTYGGPVAGVAALLTLCAVHPGRLLLGLSANAFFLAGYAITHGLGIILAQGDVRPILHFLLSIEASGTAVSFWVAQKL